MDHPKDNKYLMWKSGSSKALTTRSAARGLLDSSYHDANDNSDDSEEDEDDDDDSNYVIMIVRFKDQVRAYFHQTQKQQDRKYVSSTIFTATRISILFFAMSFVTFALLHLFCDYLGVVLNPVDVAAQEWNLSVGTIKWYELFTAALVTLKNQGLCCYWNKCYL